MKFIKKYGILILIAILLLSFIGFGWDMYFEYIELKELGGNFQSIFSTNLVYQISTYVVVLLISFALFFASLSLVNKFTNVTLRKSGTIIIEKTKLGIPALVSVVLGFFTANSLNVDFYKNVMLLLNSTSFNLSTPVTGKDVSYYMFERPFLNSISSSLCGILFAIFVITAIYYVYLFVKKKIEFSFKCLKNSPIAYHFAILAALFLFALAYKVNFLNDGIVYSQFYHVTGAGYVTANITRYLYMVAPYLLCVTVFLAVIFIFKKKIKLSIISISILPAVAILTFIITAIVQQFVVKPNEPLYEKPYLKYNMQMTREAFDLSDIKTTEITDKIELTKQDLQQNATTIENLRIVDYNAALRTNAQLESNTYFYTFVNGDVVTYDVNGKNTPVFISAREISTDKLPGAESTVNKLFKYTHGYGLVINPINKLSDKGQIESLLSGLRMQSKENIDGLNISEPRIYYGENTKNDVIVNPESSNKEKEIDMDGTVTTSYNGKGGIRLSGINKFLYAIRNADVNYLLSSNIDSNSVLLKNRQIIERAKIALPFLKIDDDAYITVSNEGRIKWVIDGYTTSSKMPYAEKIDGISYIRNSVKILIDAYDGTVEAFIIDKEDPIIRTYAKMYPQIFSKNDLPQELAKHMRYPEYLFKMQTQILNKYHLDPEKEENVGKFYENQDRWEIAKFASGTNPNENTKLIEPYYNMVKLPGEQNVQEEMVLMRPFTPSSASTKRNNMVAWCAVRNSLENYGEIILYTYPRNTNVFGPEQVEVNINQITEVSQDMTLWGQSGSEVYKGNLLTIPVNNSVLYVEPIYIQASTESSIPQVVKVIVGYQKGNDFIYSYEDTVKEALENLFKGNSLSSPVETPETNIPVATEAPTSVPSLQPDKLPKPEDDEYELLQKKIDELDKQIDEIKEILSNEK